MRKITTNTKVELTEKEVKFINDIRKFWITLNHEFNEGYEINGEEFTNFLCAVVDGRDHTTLNNETIEIVRN